MELETKTERKRRLNREFQRKYRERIKLRAQLAAAKPVGELTEELNLEAYKSDIAKATSIHVSIAGPPIVSREKVGDTPIATSASLSKRSHLCPSIQRTWSRLETERLVKRKFLYTGPSPLVSL
ncbi:hypothetical protein DSO57_1029358 [Entomophthora muscae]|uniref:Uncharacterized protein n=1 Tax=Entomophthora muscae TaxID=34485 RepID=A0ACC2RFV5_9FUNG|nr:hypothetical protein DSO57_1029358 [Entomophthora muscae]